MSLFICECVTVVAGLVFVVDSTDVDRMEEARGELMRVLQADDLEPASLLVFANKQVP